MERQTNFGSSGKPVAIPLDGQQRESGVFAASWVVSPPHYGASTGGNGGSPSTALRPPNGAEGLGDRQVDLVIPARPDMLRVVRLSASVVASRVDLAYEELDDLCLAIDELGVLVLGAGAHGEARMWVRFSWDTAAVMVQYLLPTTAVVGKCPEPNADPAEAPGSADGVDADQFDSHRFDSHRFDVDRFDVASTGPRRDDEPLSRLILAALVDDYEVTQGHGHTFGWLYKRRVGATR